ncbi:hypothetical protein CCACVL1_26064, partial [Corchorus capsularis]
MAETSIAYQRYPINVTPLGGNGPKQ